MSDFSVLAISGSLRDASFNTALIRAAQRFAPEGMTIERYRNLAAIPAFNEDIEPEPPAPVVDLRERIAAADALLIATPEYNYGVPGVLKNALDWASRPSFPVTSWVSPLAHKPVAIMGAAPTGMGTVRAQLQLRQLFLWTDSAVLSKPEIIVTNAHEKLTVDGDVKDETTEALLRGLLDALGTRIGIARLAATA
ncbi:NADPH-dependent FMN reductase [Micromonospora endolithica]|uniref:NAD(P)H-dependent oxidoreductase n=1 Tax=Micromonospora endolithica TaxID=230091 RepID=A0A3A9ZS75_9ACTN|nr:NADPH-dependent FMN reductase [Micromonospora endolithica]RKN50983.1 NAD(P)H-dependent oxidoreductase [Micromonospora endolithica]TWJ20232.1 chromate reductase [Micromonospora endolithica]